MTESVSISVYHANQAEIIKKLDDNTSYWNDIEFSVIYSRTYYSNIFIAKKIPKMMS
jgi:hypothetical protein